MKILPFLFACTALATPALADDAPAIMSETASYERLHIARDAIPSAPEGKLLTLTVDGVEMPIAPGDYQGRVVLTVTDDIPVKYHDLPIAHFRAALYVENGAPVWSKSVRAALGRGSAGSGKAELLDIRSDGPRFNGVIVTGNGKYEIDRPVIDMVGNGGNDFAGFGAAIMATGNANVTLRRPIIRTRGAIRTALFTGGNAVMHVDNAHIETLDGILPPDYKFTVDVGRMMEVPWMLGLAGNVRSSNLVDQGTLYITNSYIRSQGWGALSTDDNKHVRMFVKDTLVELMEGGYGTYSIGDSVNVFDHSIIRSPDIGGIMAAEGSLTLTNGSRVEAGTYGVMMHSGLGGGTLTIDKGSEVHAGRAAIQVKGIATTIVVDDATVTSANGIILQAMENDDPFMVALLRGEIPEGMTAPPPGMTGPGSPGGSEMKDPPPNPNVIATFRNTSLTGDIWNARTIQGGMVITLEGTQLKGRISTSIAAPVSGKAPTRATYREIGNVTNTASPTDTGHGLTVHLSAKSHWTVTGTSYLTGLTLEKGALIDGGTKKVSIRVDGKRVAIRPGKYSGNIVLKAH